MSYLDRKQARRKYFEKYVKGWRLQECSACSGSGRYDHNGSPKCGACEGTGKTRVSPAARASLEEFLKKNFKKP